MISFFKKTKSFIITIAVFCAAMIILIWMGWMQRTNDERTVVIQAALQRNSNLAVAFEQYTIRTINNVDAILQMVKSEYEQKGNNIQINRLLDSRFIDRDFAIAVGIANEKGDVILADFPIKPDTIINIIDRPHFRYHIENPNGGLYVSQPIISRTLGKAVIPFTRRVNKKDGSFGGIVSVQIFPSAFTSIYSHANLRPLDFISLIAPNGITYARRTGTKESYGENIIKSPLFQHVAKKSTGTYYAPDAIRHIPTFFSYRKLEKYPIIATVGTTEKDVLADYYVKVDRERKYIIIITVLMLAFSIFLSVWLLLRKKHLDRVKESEEKYRTIYEKSNDAILLLNAEQQVIDANSTAHHLFKIEKEQFNTYKLTDLAQTPDQLPALKLQEEPNANKSYKELRFLRSDGSVFIGEITSAHYENSLQTEQWIVIIRDVTDRIRLNKKLLVEQKKYQRDLTKQVILAQEQERELIGRELHDNVNQILTTVKLYLEMVLSDKTTADKVLPKSIGHLTECITEIRKISRNLSAPTLGTRSLKDSIADLVDMVSSSSGLTIDFNHEAYYDPLPKEQKLAIFRIVQEQLNNVVKHANANTVNIVLKQTEKETQMTICDNGNGFDITAQRNGIGLNNIQSRVKIFDGVLNIQTAHGKGCCLFISLPIKEETV